MGCPRGLVARVKRQSERLFAFALALGSFGGALWTFPATASVPSDRTVAEKLVAELSELPDKERPVVHVVLERSRHALTRATGARDSGDTRAAELLEGIAREWAETGQDLLRAARAESELKALQAKAAEASEKAERARMLLEEAVARKGRAEAELRKTREPVASKPATKEAAR